MANICHYIGGDGVGGDGIGDDGIGDVWGGMYVAPANTISGDGNVGHCPHANCGSCIKPNLFLPEASTICQQVDIDLCLKFIAADSIAATATDSITTVYIDDREIDEIIVMECARELYREGMHRVGVQIIDAYNEMHSFLMENVSLECADLDVDLVAYQIQQEEAKGAMSY